MRRGLLLLVTVAVGALVLSACLPPAPDPVIPAAPTTPSTSPSTTTTTKAPATTTTTKPPTTTTKPAVTTTTSTTTTTRPPTGGSWAQNGSLGSCTVFPADNAWNRDVSSLPVDTNSASYLAGIAGLGGNQKLHADFGGAGEYGIPYITVPGTQAKVPVDFTDYGDESDPGPYPIPLNAPVEGGSDAHVLAVDRDHCKLYELFASSPGSSRWSAASGAVFDLTSNALRPEGWTSADAAGLPMFPGLLRYEEAATGEIRHAIRFTVQRAQRAYVAPARHLGTRQTPACLPYGARLRLRASFPEAPYRGPALAVVRALKRYGMIFADQGSAVYLSGTSDARWEPTIGAINQEHPISGADFEVVRLPAITRDWKPSGPPSGAC